MNKLEEFKKLEEELHFILNTMCFDNENPPELTEILKIETRLAELQKELLVHR